MDDPVTTIDFSPSGNHDPSHPLEHEDVDATQSDRTIRTLLIL